MRWAWLALLLVLAPQPAPPEETPFAIEGTVVRLGTTEPLSGIEVTLIRPNPEMKLERTPELQAVMESLASRVLSLSEPRSTLLSRGIADGEKTLGLPPGTLLLPEITTVTTDEAGKFIFKNLSPGPHTLRAQRDGYFAPLINGVALPVVSRRITLDEDHTSTKVEFGMSPGGMIRGRVLDPDGMPVLGVEVHASQVIYENSARNPYENGRASLTPMITNAGTHTGGSLNGEYSLPWLPPGRYYIEADPAPNKDLVRTLYPNARDTSSAVLVTVSGGAVTTGIDITFRREDRPRFKISGTAVNPLSFGQAFSSSGSRSSNGNRTVSTFLLAPREPGIMDPEIPPTFENAISRNENGEFEIRDVLPGNYNLYAVYMGNFDSVGSGSDANRWFIDRTPVEVRDADVKDIHLTISPGVSLEGEVVINGSRGNPVTLNAMKVSLRAQETMPRHFASLVGTIPVDSSGKFHAEHVPEGKFKLALGGLPDGAYIEDIRQGGRSVFDDGFVLYGQSSSIQVVVNPRGVVVDGVVENFERKPVPYVTVVLVPPEQQRRNPSRYRTVISDESGKFSMKTVPPGVYTAYAWEGVLPYSWLDDNFYSRYQGQGKIVNVVPNSRIQLQLLAIPPDVQ